MTLHETLTLVIGSAAIVVLVEYGVERRRYEAQRWLAKSACKKCGQLKPGFYLYESDRAGGMVCVNCFEKAENRHPPEFHERIWSKSFMKLRSAYEKKHGPL